MVTASQKFKRIQYHLYCIYCIQSTGYGQWIEPMTFEEFDAQKDLLDYQIDASGRVF